MKLEVIATGKDVNEAIDSGCAQLGIERGDAEFEIIERQKKGFLGFGSHPAKVRVYLELPDPKPEKPAPAPAPAPAPRPVKPAPAPRPAQSAPAPAPKKETPAPAPVKPEPVQTEPQEPAAEKTGAEPEKKETPARQPKPERPRRERAPRAPRPEEEPAEPEQPEIVPAEEVREKVEKSAAYIQEILKEMGFEDVEVTPKYYEANVCLHLEGSGLGIIIGRRGETLDALQYLASLVANRGEGDYIRININSGNYREKREKTLSALARKLALQVARTGKSITLEPMNPYERRVIHGAVSKIRGATSASVGTDPNRRVVISCTEPPRPKEFSGKGGKPRKGGRPYKKNFQTADAEAETELKTAPEAAAPEAPAAEPAETAARPPRERRDFKPRPPRRDGRPPRGPRPPRGKGPGQGRTEGEASSAPAEKAQPVNDAELFADLPRGVPLIGGAKTEKTAAPVQKKEKTAGSRYGKIEL